MVTSLLHPIVRVLLQGQELLPTQLKSPSMLKPCISISHLQHSTCSSIVLVSFPSYRTQFTAWGWEDTDGLPVPLRHIALWEVCFTSPWYDINPFPLILSSKAALPPNPHHHQSSRHAWCRLRLKHLFKNCLWLNNIRPPLLFIFNYHHLLAPQWLPNSLSLHNTTSSNIS